jgi:hypothetical protein
MRADYLALRRGRQVVRAQSKTPGLFAVSRIGNDGREILIAFNTSTTALVSQVEVESASLAFKSVRGPCSVRASAPGSVEVKLLPLSYIVCVGGPQ